MPRPRYPQAASCAGKHAYATYGAVHKAFMHIRQRLGKPGCFSPYRCQYCHDWHLGNNPERRRRPRE